MAGFIYAVKDDPTPVTADKARAWGLGYAFTGTIENRPVNGNTPWSGAGNVFLESSRHHGRNAGIYADRQTWRRLPKRDGRPELWLGYWNDAKPTPEDLARSPMLAADMVIRLADGSAWRIPKVRQFDGVTGNWECLLPSLYDLDDDGNLFPAKPLAKHAHLWEITHPIAMAMCVKTDEPSNITDEQVRECAISLLQSNYVVDLPELVTLELLATGDTFASIVMAACRGKELLEWVDSLQKKSDGQPALSGFSSTDGDEG